ncbi:MAG TPA: hypothetical protein VJA21_33575 [Verrucomicrobiae bacterium]
MKTNHFARIIRRIRVAAVCLGLVALTVGSFTLGGSLAARFGQMTASPSAGQQPPNVSLADVMSTLS